MGDVVYEVRTQKFASLQLLSHLVETFGGFLEGGVGGYGFAEVEPCLEISLCQSVHLGDDFNEWFQRIFQGEHSYRKADGNTDKRTCNNQSFDVGGVDVFF